jgi:hypothetical protein
VRRRKRTDPADTEGDSIWLQLAQEEVALRRRLHPKESDGLLDLALNMEARLTTTYPDIPSELKNQFSARLSAQGSSEEAWIDAVGWLESTDWFRFRSRRPGT